MKNLSYKLGILIFSLVSLNSYAQLYTVNTATMGINNPVSGGATGSLDEMIESAIIYAESGGGLTATIELDVSAGVIPITANLPEINHALGKIIIKKALGAPDQHLEGTTDVCFFGDSPHEVEIIDLIFNGFTTSVPSIPKGAIDFENPGSIQVTDCIFSNSFYGVSYRYQDEEQINPNLIENNTFINCDVGVSIVYDRTILTDGTYLFGNDYSGNQTSVLSNTYTSCGTGILTKKYANDIFVNFLLQNNNITGSIGSIEIGIQITNPLFGFYTCSDNHLQDLNIGIYSGNSGDIYAVNGSESEPHGMNFIATPNSIGLSEENEGNLILNCKIAFKFSPELYNPETSNFEYSVIGYAAEGAIEVSDGYPVFVRENLLTKGPSWSSWSTSMAFPIELSQDPSTGSVPGNNYIGEPVLIQPAQLLDYITISYETSGLNVTPANAPFVAEFFEVNSDNSVIQYIGNQTITSHLPDSYSQQFFGVTIAPGNKIGMTLTSIGDAGEKIGTSEFGYSGEITDLEVPTCESCIATFKPIPNEKYWMSAWVNVEDPNQVKTYDGVSLEVLFVGGTSGNVTFTPTGEIIDGWQRIVGSFTVPYGTEYLGLNLNANTTYDTYFDDIRIHPFNASMKSYVYDGETFWLTSELDDNNYATFYEYDEEGGLIRIKKETARGVVTIQETRSNTTKTTN